MPLTPLPSMGQMQGQAVSAARVLPDDRAIRVLVERVIRGSGLSQGAIARNLGITPQAISRYRKNTIRPSMVWMTKLVEACGGRVIVELPGSLERESPRPRYETGRTDGSETERV